MAEPGLIPLAQAPGEGELGLLQEVRARGFPVVETWAAVLWEEFARLNNLPERLMGLFRGVFGVRIDEERLLLAAEEAGRLVRESYLLPERAEAFLETLKGRGPFLVRPPGKEGFLLAATPQEALFALKRLWAEAFRVEAILERRPALLPEALPLLVQRAGGAAEDPFLSLDLSRALGKAVVAYAWEGRVVRVG
ncbi:hypothetical protein [Thermus thermamylovorans]|uniref:Uncharacterized protein n=1 Tax=Thermus thermamylovorans TaxID=2509362 RepID=A0A4Q9AWU0_9DEIN|nr:hypothetical protein [Thermus thermamylovorans]TBH15465.1 hypothetical protein ETP66_10960 [Thermus thermamylovorans]